MVGPGVCGLGVCFVDWIWFILGYKIKGDPFGLYCKNHKDQDCNF